MRACWRASDSVFRRWPRSCGELPGPPLVLDRLDVLAGLADAVEPQHLNRVAGPGLLDPLPRVVVHRPDPAPDRAGDQRIADPNRPALDQHGRHRPAPRIQVGLDHHARAGRRRVRLQLLELGGQDDHLEQVVEALLGLRGDVAEDRFAAPVLRGEPLRGELVAHPVGLGVLPVDLVDRDQHRDLRRARVVDRLDGLRHHAVIGRHDDHGEVGDLGAAGSHRRERLVARGVEEGDPLSVLVDLVGADVLGDPARLAGDDLRLPDRVQERRLAVVDVTHDRHHRWALRKVCVGVVVNRLAVLVLGGADDLDLLVEGLRQRGHGLVGERLRQRRHLAELHQLLDHLGAAEAQRLGHLSHGGARVDLGRRLLDDLDRPPIRRLLEERRAGASRHGVAGDVGAASEACARDARPGSRSPLDGAFDPSAPLRRRRPAPRAWPPPMARAAWLAACHRRLRRPPAQPAWRVAWAPPAPSWRRASPPRRSTRPAAASAFSASPSSTLEAATFASIPAVLSAARTSLLVSPCCLAISWTRFFKIPRGPRAEASGSSDASAPTRAASAGGSSAWSPSASA